MKKTLVITEWAPPIAEGAMILLGRLLRQFPGGSYSILARPAHLARSPVDSSHELDCEQCFLHVFSISGAGRVCGAINRILGYLSIPSIVVQGVALAKVADDVLVTSMGSGFVPIAAYLVHLITGKPLFVYLFDAWWELVTSRVDKFMAAVFTGRILRAASKVFVMSEALEDLCRRCYGVESVMMPHPVDLSLYRLDGRPERSDGEARVVFTGAVYSPHLEAIKRMADVVNSLDKVRLVLYTPRSPAELEAAGITGRNIEYGFVPAREVPSVQMLADVLFLPFGFDFANPALIATASPSKMPEYLAAGRPILIHAPSYSYVARHARKYGFGLVVDEPDEEKLKEALLLLLKDGRLRRRLVDNARALARTHDLQVVSNRLKSFLL